MALSRRDQRTLEHMRAGEVLSFADLVHLVEALGFRLVRQRGSHRIYKQPPSEEVMAFAWSNASDEAGTCGVFFTVVSQCLANMPTGESQELSRGYDQASDQAYTLALTYAQLAGMRDEAAIASVRMMHDQMWGRISNNCAIIAILTADFGESCVTVINDSEGRAQHWMSHAQRRLRPRR